MAKGIIIFGPSGAGKTTLGKLVAQELGIGFIDIDDYIWRQDTPVPFTTLYPRDERISRLMDAVAKMNDFVMAGSMTSFHEHFDPLFILAVHLTAETSLRVTRVHQRECAMFGDRLMPGGDMAQEHQRFLEDVALYDTGGGSMDRRSHTQWAESLRCKVLRLDGGDALETNVAIIAAEYRAITPILGLKRGTVYLSPHHEQWRERAREAMAQLKALLADIAVDIQHVGSTAITGIRAKPIIDIVVGVNGLGEVRPYIRRLEQHGIIFRGQDVEGQLLFVMGAPAGSIRTHHIHVVIWGSPAWLNYLDFRDYLNACPKQAKIYEECKQTLAVRYPNDRGRYTAGKQNLITRLLEEAQHWRAQNKERNI